jgi:hypothetical protein
VLIIMTIALVIAGAAAYNTHFIGAALIFGTTDASLALLTFVITLSYWFKLSKKACPCNWKGGCGDSCGCGSGSGCGAGCDCGPSAMPYVAKPIAPSKPKSTKKTPMY